MRSRSSTRDVIVHLTTVHPRSDIRVFVKESRTLARELRHHVVLIVADGEGDSDLGEGDVTVRDLGRLTGSRIGRVVRSLGRVFRVVRSIRPQVVHFHDPELLPVALALKATGMRVIYDVHEDVPQLALTRDWVPDLLRAPAAWFLNVLELLSAGLFDLIVAATPKIAERFPDEKTVVVQNFPVVEEGAPEIRVHYGDRPPALAYVGVISKLRSAVEMVHALELLPGVRLELAGGFSPHELQETLRERPGWEAVEYHGQLARDEVDALLTTVRAGLVLFHPVPNHLDAQPNKMFEYMAASLPVIASDFPLWREIIDGVGCGVLVDPLDPCAIADGVRWILEHPEEAAAMGRRGRWAVEERYNWGTEAARLERAYRTLLN